MVFESWRTAVLALIPDSMVYIVDLKKYHKAGLSSAAAIEAAREAGQVHLKGSSSAPKPITYGGSVPLSLGGKRRKPLWDRARIEAKVRAACYAVIVEAETHRLEPDGLAYVREMKARLLAG